MPFASRRAISVLCGMLAGCHRPYVVPPGSAPQTIIINVGVIDGLGGARRRANVLIDGDRISAVGRLRPGVGDRVIDGRGLVVAPGFIDTQSTLDRGILFLRDVPDAVSQGVTTVVIGGAGESVHPLRALFDSLRRSPASVNVASYAGHRSLRAAVIGGEDKRPATPSELAQMKLELSHDLGAGALGLSGDFDRDSAGGAMFPEMIELARLAADSAGAFSGVIDGRRNVISAAEDFARLAGEARIRSQVLLWSTLASFSCEASGCPNGGRGRRYSVDLSDSLAAIFDRARSSGLNLTAAVCLHAAVTLARIVEWPHAVFCNRSGQRESMPYVPSFLWGLGQMVRDRKAMSLETAIRKSTSLAAATIGVQDRGSILPGQYADLVLFEEALVQNIPPSGTTNSPPGAIRAVWVNGVVVYRNGQPTGAHPGRVLLRAGVSPDR